MTVRTCTATIVLAASLLGLAGFAAPASAQRASCGQLAGMIASEQALERQARDEQRGFLVDFGDGPRGGALRSEGGIPMLRPTASRALQNINARVRRHSGNVARLQSQYGRMGCNQTQQARQPGIDPAAAAAVGIGIGVLMGGYSSGGYRGSRGYGSSGRSGYGGGGYRRY